MVCKTGRYRVNVSEADDRRGGIFGRKLSLPLDNSDVLEDRVITDKLVPTFI